MIEEFVGRMFALRDASHVAHWASRSYAQHKALGKFYDEIIEKVDGIVEAYQGYFGLIGPVAPLPYSREAIMDQIQSEAKWLGEHCDEICRGNGAIENMLYDLEAMFASTYYKLKFLK